MAKRPRPSVGGQLDELVGEGGLDHLIHAPSVTRTLTLDQLRPLPSQPRRYFDDVTLTDLAQSIREQGVLQPLLVRSVDDGYEIVAGERRYRAARLAGLNEVPVLVRHLTDEEARTLALVENLQREDLNPVDRADATAHLVARALGISPDRVPAQLSALRKHPDREEHVHLITQVEEVFKIVGGSWRSFLVHLLPVLRYPEDVLAAVRAGHLEYTKGAVLARVADAEQRADLLRLALEGTSLGELQRAARPRRQVDAAQSRARQVARSLNTWSQIERLPVKDQKRVAVLLDELHTLLNTQQQISTRDQSEAVKSEPDVSVRSSRKSSRK